MTYQKADLASRWTEDMNADWFREVLIDKRDQAPASHYPGRKSAASTVKNMTSARYKRRNVIERMFGRIKDWRRVRTRYETDSPTVLPLRNRSRRNVIFWL